MPRPLDVRLESKVQFEPMVSCEFFVSIRMGTPERAKPLPIDMFRPLLINISDKRLNFKRASLEARKFTSTIGVLRVLQWVLTKLLVMCGGRPIRRLLY